MLLAEVLLAQGNHKGAKLLLRPVLSYLPETTKNRASTPSTAEDSWYRKPPISTLMAAEALWDRGVAMSREAPAEPWRLRSFASQVRDATSARRLRRRTGSGSGNDGGEGAGLFGRRGSKRPSFLRRSSAESAATDGSVSGRRRSGRWRLSRRRSSRDSAASDSSGGGRSNQGWGRGWGRRLSMRNSREFATSNAESIGEIVAARLAGMPVDGPMNTRAHSV
ncbi:hypothetical protein JKP88DRAFT_219084 [Tribonema minus]|uniref:Uncharacterized protein n=1 Tax=Tribonema minus TaxID=303371 RepID=A0A835Z610_9STRA|nr:hypothetical protein JKP88DRAFT_219084 [Tribonema minus]